MIVINIRKLFSDKVFDMLLMKKRFINSYMKYRERIVDVNYVFKFNV